MPHTVIQPRLSGGACLCGLRRRMAGAIGVFVGAMG